MVKLPVRKISDPSYGLQRRIGPIFREFAKLCVLVIGSFFRRRGAIQFMSTSRHRRRRISTFAAYISSGTRRISTDIVEIFAKYASEYCAKRPQKVALRLSRKGEQVAEIDVRFEMGGDGVKRGLDRLFIGEA